MTLGGAEAEGEGEVGLLPLAALLLLSLDSSEAITVASPYTPGVREDEGEEGSLCVAALEPGVAAAAAFECVSVCVCVCEDARVRE